MRRLSRPRAKPPTPANSSTTVGFGGGVGHVGPPGRWGQATPPVRHGMLRPRADRVGAVHRRVPRALGVRLRAIGVEPGRRCGPTPSSGSGRAVRLRRRAVRAAGRPLGRRGHRPPAGPPQGVRGRHGRGDARHRPELAARPRPRAHRGGGEVHPAVAGRPSPREHQGHQPHAAQGRDEADFFTSHLYRKLRAILFLPIQKNDNSRPHEWYLRPPFLWLPSTEQLDIIRREHAMYVEAILSSAGRCSASRARPLPRRQHLGSADTGDGARGQELRVVAQEGAHHGILRDNLDPFA
jgi:hypothetical protein